MERTPTLKGWIWENVVGVMDTILSSVRMKLGAKKKPDGDIEVKVRRKKYIMGILSEKVSMTCSLIETLRKQKKINPWCGHQLSQEDISEESVLEDSMIGEGSIIELLKKDATHAMVNAGHEISVSNVTTSPGRVYKTSSVRQSHLYQTSSGHEINVSNVTTSHVNT